MLSTYLLYFRILVRLSIDGAKAWVAGPSRDSHNVVGATSLMGDCFYNGHVCVRCGFKIIKEL